MSALERSRGRERRAFRGKKKWFVLGALLVAGALFANTFRASPLPLPPPFTDSAPVSASPSEMAVYRLPTGVTHRSAGFAYRGGSFSDKRDFAMAATLVRHPRGDLLIDTGLGTQIDTQFKEMPFWFRATTKYTRARSASEQLDAAGYDRKSLRGILLTHAHWDHVSGVPDFPGVPVLVTASERKFIAEGGWIEAVARGEKDVTYEEYAFEGGPYLGFPKSHDVYGDGSIVVVPAPGHTPGSVIVFLTLHDGRRFALIGDLAWQTEGIVEREERPWLQRTLADDDPALLRESLLRMSALAARFPEMTIVPAHDARGFAKMESLPDSSGPSP